MLWNMIPFYYFTHASRCSSWVRLSKSISRILLLLASIAPSGQALAQELTLEQLLFSAPKSEIPVCCRRNLRKGSCLNEECVVDASKVTTLSCKSAVTFENAFRVVQFPESCASNSWTEINQGISTDPTLVCKGRGDGDSCEYLSVDFGPNYGGGTCEAWSESCKKAHDLRQSAEDITQAAESEILWQIAQFSRPIEICEPIRDYTLGENGGEQYTCRHYSAALESNWERLLGSTAAVLAIGCGTRGHALTLVYVPNLGYCAIEPQYLSNLSLLQRQSTLEQAIRNAVVGCVSAPTEAGEQDMPDVINRLYRLLSINAPSWFQGCTGQSAIAISYVGYDPNVHTLVRDVPDAGVQYFHLPSVDEMRQLPN